MPEPDVAVSFFARFRGWIVGHTGVFIVLPALINAGNDIYAVIRERTYENGVVEQQVINPRSGEILNSLGRQRNLRPSSVAAPTTVGMPKIAPIDLHQFRGPGRTVVVGAGSATGSNGGWQEALKAGLSWCEGKETFLSHYLCSIKEKNKWCESENQWDKVKECAR